MRLRDLSGRFFLAVFILAAMPFAEAKVLQTYEQEALENAIIHCIMPIKERKNVEVEAAKNIVALSDEKARKIDPTASKVFTILSSRGVSYLSVQPSGSCRVFVREVKVMDFWTEVEGAFGARSPFLYIETNEMPDGMAKTYRVDFDGPAELQIYVRDEPRDGQFQVMVNFFRTHEDEE